MQRRLASIMVGDVVGSTVAMELDEEAAVSRVSACLDAVSDTITNHAGRVFNRAGDAVLAEFQSPVNALRAAMAARSALLSVPGATPKDMRFGLHLADVLVMGGDLRGDGVNLAARIQAGAGPGEIEVSGALFEQVRRNSPCVFDEVGWKTFKGVSEPIAIYRIREPLDRNRFRPVHARTEAVVRKRPFSLAVLPFRWAGGNDDQQWIADRRPDP
jgi:adenylate cyclase